MEYEEIVEKLLAEGYIVKKPETPQACPQTFFKEAIEYMAHRYSFQSQYNGGWGVAWDHIRKAVQWRYGASTVRQIPYDKKDEANAVAMKMIDALYD